MSVKRKTRVFSFKGFDNAHYRATEQYAALVSELYNRATAEIAKYAAKGNYNLDKPFSFADYPKTREKVQEVINQLSANVEAVVEKGSRRQWLFANKKNDEFISSIMDTSKLSKARLVKYQDRNLDALKAFQGRKVDGMNLSQRVWKYTKQYQEQIEIGLDVGLGEGRSAAQLSRDLRQNLQNPNALFRRVRDKRGNLVLSKAAKAFHPGQGVYRSAYKNAMRLTRSEINMSYRESDWLRWQSLDFIVGFEVRRSNKEPKCKCKLCERLVGRYPKTFKFKGWHPQCLCHAIPIIQDADSYKKQEEADLRSALYGTPKTKVQASNAVIDFPDEFKAWASENADAQSGWRNTPYFVRDNFKGGLLSEGLKYIPTEKPLTLPERAKIRHQQRTPEQVKEIQDRWDERKKKHSLIIKVAENVLNLAKDYNEVDYSALQRVVDAGALNKMQSLTREAAKAISEMKKQEQTISDLIPDVHQWHKQFTLEELKAVHSSIEKKLDSWSSLSLDQQAKKLKFEAEEYFGTDKYGAQTKYKTWGVAQAAYKMRLDKVQYKIDKQAIEVSTSHSFAFSQTTKSVKVKQLVLELKDLLGNDASISELQDKADFLNSEVAKLEAVKLARDLKKSGKLGKVFTADAYTKERKDKAVWCKNMSESKRTLLKIADDVYNQASASEIASVYAYTSGSGHINRPLRGYDKSWDNFKGIGKVPLNNEYHEAEKRINEIEKMISRSSYPTDIWVQRGVDSGGLCGFLGIKSISELSECVGKIVTDTAFISCGAAKGTGFGGYILNIYCPKGTKMLYIDGRSAYPNENEMLLQRNTSFRVTKVTGKFIDLEVISQ